MNRQYANVILSAFFLLAGCVSTAEVAEPKTLVNNPAKPTQAVSRRVYDYIQCVHCDRDFERVAVPEDYELPTYDLGACLAYVFRKDPESRNVLISAMLECAEKTP